VFLKQKNFNTIKNKYHKRIPTYYRRAHGIMSDEELDIAIYGYEIVEVA
jgi:hypothetical protein